MFSFSSAGELQVSQMRERVQVHDPVERPHSFQARMLAPSTTTGFPRTENKDNLLWESSQLKSYLLMMCWGFQINFNLSGNFQSPCNIKDCCHDFSKLDVFLDAIAPLAPTQWGCLLFVCWLGTNTFKVFAYLCLPWPPRPWAWKSFSTIEKYLATILWNQMINNSSINYFRNNPICNR